jgi:hypothetical protein
MAADQEEVLVSMKRPKQSAKEAMPAMPLESSPYSYGLCLRLENFELDALKMKLPTVGQVFELEAKVVVTAVAESQSAGNKGDRSVSLQITDLMLGPTLEQEE